MASLSTATLRIDLTTDCPNQDTYDYEAQRAKTEWCRGGRIYRRTGGNLGTLEATDEDCGTCRGTGEVLTADGRMIVDLVRTWIKE